MVPAKTVPRLPVAQYRCSAVMSLPASWQVEQNIKSAKQMASTQREPRGADLGTRWPESNFPLQIHSSSGVSRGELDLKGDLVHFLSLECILNKERILF